MADVLKYPSTAGFVDGVGSNWVSANNVFADDGLYASNSSNTKYSSAQLYVTNFGFNIPDNAEIVGLEVIVEGRNSNGTHRTNNITYIRDPATSLNDVNSVNNASGVWSTSYTIYTMGGPTNLWGINLTPTYVNDANFGVHFYMSSATNAVVTYVDYFAIKIYYKVDGVFCLAMSAF